MDLSSKIAVTAAIQVAVAWFIGDYCTSLTWRWIAAAMFIGGTFILMAATLVAVWS